MGDTSLDKEIVYTKASEPGGVCGTAGELQIDDHAIETAVIIPVPHGAAHSLILIEISGSQPGGTILPSPPLPCVFGHVLFQMTRATGKP